jgi:DNA-binding transcriptional LysR family regulator
MIGFYVISTLGYFIDVRSFAVRIEGMSKMNSWNGVSIERLEALVRLSRHESILAANGNDQVSANLMGRQLRELRDALEVPLTKKQGRQTGLNEKGAELARIVSNFFDALEAFKDDSSENSTLYSIGTGDSLISKVLIPNFSKMRDLANGARMVFMNRRGSDVIRQIRNGELDVGILSRAHCEGKGVETFSLKTIGYSLFVPSGYEDLVPAKKPFKALAEIPFATLEGSGELNDLIEPIAMRNKIKLRPAFQGTSLLQVSQVIQSGECCGILPDFFSKGFEEGTVGQFSLSGLKKLRREYLVAWKKDTVNFKPRIEIDIVEAIRTIFLEL